MEGNRGFRIETKKPGYSGNWHGVQEILVVRATDLYTPLQRLLWRLRRFPPALRLLDRGGPPERVSFYVTHCGDPWRLMEGLTSRGRGCTFRCPECDYRFRLGSR